MAASKADDLSPEHLKWLVSSRAANQQAALELFNLFEQYPEKLKSAGLSRKAQSLVAVCFSLWRAAFLADRTGMRKAVFEDAKLFLGKMLIDNAITYPQDRGAREFTFNYYMTNATEGLLRFAEQHWPQIDLILNTKWSALKKKKLVAALATTLPQRRWDKVEHAFEVAIGCLRDHLKK
jgi:hypothetical protein